MLPRVHMQFIFSFILLGTLVAQDYTPIIINGEVFFKTELETTDGLVFSDVTIANFEKIDGVLYNRVFFKRGFEPDMFIGHMREEPNMGTLYFRPLSSELDLLIYDISLDVGDVINLSARWCDGISGDAAQVTEVIENDGVRELVFNRQVGEQDICETLRFIEGLGPNASVIFPYFRDALTINGSAQRICHASHSGMIYYPENTTVDLCDFDFTSTDDLKANQIELFPNPAQDFITIKTENQERNHVALYNIVGKRVWVGVIDYTHPLDVSNLDPGVYHLVLGEIGATQFKTRFVKF